MASLKPSKKTKKIVREDVRTAVHANMMRESVATHITRHTKPDLERIDSIRKDLGSANLLRDEEVLTSTRHTEGIQRLKSLVAKQWDLSTAKKQALKNAYARALSVLKFKIPVSLLNLEATRIAQTKLERIMGIKNLPIRFEHLSRAMTEIGKTPKTGGISEEVIPWNNPGEWIRELQAKLEPPAIAGYNLWSRASRETDWSHKFYNCALLIEPKGSGLKPFASGWGITSRAQVLGIMVFDHRPEVLAEVAKTMAKRRPKDPIPILDMYGKPFYPLQESERKKIISSKERR